MSIELLKTRTDLSVNEFEQLLDKETNVKVYEKLNFLKLIKEGYSTKNAYKLANISKSTAYLTKYQWNEGGYQALLRKKGGGRNPKLNNEQLNELNTAINEKNFSSESEVQKFIKNTWDEEYTIAGVKNLLISQLNINLNEITESSNDLTKKIETQIKIIENTPIENDKEINRLVSMISEEKNTEVLKKLIYLLFRRLGFSNTFASKLMSITTATGTNWTNKWRKKGYNGLKRKKGQGRKCKLSDEDIEDLKKN